MSPGDLVKISIDMTQGGSLSSVKYYSNLRTKTGHVDYGVLIRIIGAMGEVMFGGNLVRIPLRHLRVANEAG